MDAIQNDSQNAINTLLLNTSFIENLGLMHGKMGISIFFFHLARQTKNQIYEDYAGELIDEIYEEITANSPVDFENGLAGIGWGIEYLVHNGFIEADTDEVLEEFDNRIFKELIYNTPKEISLLNGIVGIGVYFLKRIQNPASNDEKIPTLTNKQTLVHLIDELDRRVQDISEIIKEPEANTETLELSNNQTLEHSTPEHKEAFEPKPCFDITWDYPVLLWFLAGMYKLNIFNFKVVKILQRLIEPLYNNQSWPKLQSNRILLALALTKLRKTLETSNIQTFIIFNAETIIANLIMDLNQEIIKTELLPNNPTIRYGTSGILFIYKQLFELTTNEKFKLEIEYWSGLRSHYNQEGKESTNLESADGRPEEKIGFLEGLAGSLLKIQIFDSTNPRITNL